MCIRDSGDVPEGNVVEGGGALMGDPLADDIGLSGGQIGGDLLGAQIPAGIFRPVKVPGILLGLRLLTEAVEMCIRDSCWTPWRP